MKEPKYTAHYHFPWTACAPAKRNIFSLIYCELVFEAFKLDWLMIETSKYKLNWHAEKYAVDKDIFSLIKAELYLESYYFGDL